MLPSFETAVKNISADETWALLKKKRNYFVTIRTLLWLVAIGIFVLGIFIFDAWSSGAWVESEEEDNSYVLFLSLIIMAVAIYFGRKWSKSLFKKYSVHYKDVVIRKMMLDIVKHASYPKELGGKNRCSYTLDEGISPDTLHRSPLFEELEYNIYDGEDLFEGTLGLTNFECSEVTLIHEYQDDENHTHKDLKFKGFVFMADFHKSFEGTTIIQSRKGKKFSLKTNFGSRMKTVSYEFDQAFKIYTTDEMTARYLLPVNMLERLVQLRQKFRKYGITICLHDGIITVVIHNCDFFEVDGFGKLGTQAFRKTYDELVSVLDIIDQLNLNTRIWGKQENGL